MSKPPAKGQGLVTVQTPASHQRCGRGSPPGHRVVLSLLLAVSFSRIPWQGSPVYPTLACGPGSTPPLSHWLAEVWGFKDLTSSRGGTEMDENPGACRPTWADNPQQAPLGSGWTGLPPAWACPGSPQLLPSPGGRQVLPGSSAWLSMDACRLAVSVINETVSADP